MFAAIFVDDDCMKIYNIFHGGLLSLRYTIFQCSNLLTVSLSAAIITKEEKRNILAVLCMRTCVVCVCVCVLSVRVHWNFYLSRANTWAMQTHEIGYYYICVVWQTCVVCTDMKKDFVQTPRPVMVMMMAQCWEIQSTQCTYWTFEVVLRLTFVT